MKIRINIYSCGFNVVSVENTLDSDNNLINIIEIDFPLKIYQNLFRNILLMMICL